MLARKPWFLAALVLATGCRGGDPTSPSQLQRGGVLVVHVDGRACEGCDQLARGDLIQSVDGKPVSTAAELDALTDNVPHQLEVWDASTRETVTITITAEPNESMPPLEHAPAFWSVGAAELDRAPDWARRRLFGHASPQLLLVNVDGGFVSGRDVFGQKHLIVMFDWAAASDRQNGALAMQVVQKAQADLAAKGVEIIFAQVKHPQQRDIAPMNDTDIRAFFADNQVDASDGGPLPPPPLYRMPNKTEDNPTRVLGLEGAMTYYEAIGEAPNIFVLDERGIIRWHSAGATPDPEGEIQNDMVHTMVAAIEFALEEL